MTRRAAVAALVVVALAGCHFLVGDNLPCESTDQCPPGRACKSHTCAGDAGPARDDAGAGEGEGEGGADDGEGDAAGQ